MKLTHTTTFTVKEHTGPTTPTDLDFDAKVTDFLSFTKLLTIGAISSRMKKGQLEEPGVYQIRWHTKGKTMYSRLRRLS